MSRFNEDYELRKELQDADRRLNGVKMLISERFNKAYLDSKLDVADAMRELLERAMDL